MRGFESPTKSGVAWCSALAVARGVDDDCIIDECRADTVWRSDISCWNAPVDDVPHLLAAVTVEASGVSLSLEFLPRADGGYDLPCLRRFLSIRRWSAATSGRGPTSGRQRRPTPRLSALRGGGLDSWRP